MNYNTTYVNFTFYLWNTLTELLINTFSVSLTFYNIILLPVLAALSTVICGSSTCSVGIHNVCRWRDVIMSILPCFKQTKLIKCVYIWNNTCPNMLWLTFVNISVVLCEQSTHFVIKPSSYWRNTWLALPFFRTFSLPI